MVCLRLRKAIFSLRASAEKFVDLKQQVANWKAQTGARTPEWPVTREPRKDDGRQGE